MGSTLIEKKFLISRDQDFYKQFWQARNYILENLQNLRPLMHTSARAGLYNDLHTLYQSYLAVFKDEAALIQRGQSYRYDRYRKEKEKLIDEINQKLKRTISMARLDRDKKTHASSQVTGRVLRITTITAGLIIIIGILISLINTRVINRSILLLQQKTKEIAKGRFEEIPNISEPPEIKELADHFNTMCERLKELDEMKHDFINHVSHKLRTPLTAIREAASMLLEEGYITVPEKRRELLTITRDECEKLINSVSRILDLSRMEANMMDYYIRKCDLVPVIQKTVLKLAPIALRKKVDLELKPFPDIPEVRMDQDRIAQVVEDLLGNALKFTPRDGAIVVRVSLQTDRKVFVEVSVSDTGCGIPEDNLEKIFEKFERIENGKETMRGTGLGLSIAKHVVAVHGGRIWAQSEPGKGSTFFFTLPVA